MAVAGQLLACLLLVACATSRVDWNSRIGQYTYDQAVTDLGPPDKLARLSDGRTVGEWLTQRGYAHGSLYTFYGFGVHRYEESPAPNYFLRLIFSPEGKLESWKKFVR